MKATWDSKSEFDEDIDMANICFMVQNNGTTKVISEPILDDSDLSIDELRDAFEQLSNNYDFLKKKYLKIKKKMSFCKIN